MTFAEHYGPWALIAGASEGLGAALATEAAARGCNVALLARSADKLADVARAIQEEHGVDTRCLAIDLSSPSAVDDVLAGVADLEVGFFVYNAAAEPRGLFLETTPTSSCATCT